VITHTTFLQHRFKVYVPICGLRPTCNDQAEFGYLGNYPGKSINKKIESFGVASITKKKTNRHIKRQS